MDEGNQPPRNWSSGRRLVVFVGAVFTLVAYDVMIIIGLPQGYATLYSLIPPKTIWGWGQYRGLGAVVGCGVATV